MHVGSVVALWRFPVKSMQGEEIDEANATERGLLGDRVYALLDNETGCVVTVKHPRKWGRLFECRATFAEPPRLGLPMPPIWITLPDGTVVNSADAAVDRVLSCALGREVSLVAVAPAKPTREVDRTPIDGFPSGEVVKREQIALAAPAGTFFDYAPLHVLTTATMDRLRELYPEGRFEARRFRPNIVVATAESGFPENRWLGSPLRIGEGVRLRMIDPCPRCFVPTLAQGDLPRDPEILRTIAEHNAVASATLAPGVVLPAVAGAYASVQSGGTIRRGDTVWLE